MEDLPLRLGSMAAILAMGLLGGLLPWWMPRRAANRQDQSGRGLDLLSLGNCFAGGVILAAGFVHLLGDAASGYAEAFPDGEFPWPFALAAASFVSILAVERVIPQLPRDEHGGDPEAAALVAAASSGAFPYLLLLTLSIHSLIAGLALGTQASLSGFTIVLVAILAHKGSAAFALGVSMHRAEIDRRRAMPLIVGFSAMTPLGVLAGILLTRLATSNAEAQFEVWFDSIAAGTFIYIGALDIVREEFIPARRGRRQRFLATGVGLVLMTLVAIWT